jgi:chromosome segregation protein
MKLSSIEIKGFKSFGDRVIIHFDHGTTAIVGPNGSGKSNVVDAIRWVLGEQKIRLLRSEKMENVIFNGTKNRKPANLAEVTLTFENTRNILPVEYSTISITRRLIRNGESEYYLNGTHCRLKDITDLFMDTGIGPDSYSIIELKMVDDILNDKNNTIKQLLEEAAGISKYKLRKKQTLVRLEETESDLNRVNDLLFEIEKSMKQLESQARRATRFYRLKEEYRQLALQVAWHAMMQYKKESEEIRKNEQVLKDDKISIQTKIKTLEASHERLKTESLEKEKKLSAAQKALNDLLIQISRLESDENNRNERIRFLNDKLHQLEEQIEKDTEQHAGLQQVIENLQAERLAEQARCDLASAEFNELKEQVTEKKFLSDKAQKELAEWNQKLQALRQQVHDIETRLAIIRAKKVSLHEEMERIVDRQKEWQEKLAESDAARQQLLTHTLTLQEQIQNTEKAIHELIQQHEHESALLTQLNEKLTQEKRLYDARINEYELTKNLVEQMDGYPESIKFLKRSSGRIRSAPLLAEIIHCREEFKVAIENYLEPFLNHFVVHTRAEAHEAIVLLRQQQAGRAQFFILDELRHRPTLSYPVLPHCLRALDAVEFSPEYAPLFHLLLGHVYLADDDSAADQFDLAADDNTVLIARQGHYIRQKYCVSGGSTGLFDGKRTGKMKNLERLAHLIRQHQEEMERLEKAIGHTRSRMEAIGKQREELSRCRNQQDEQLHEIQSKIAAFEDRCLHLRETISTSQQTLAVLEKQRQQLDEEDQGDDLHSLHTDELHNRLALLTEEVFSTQQKADTLLNEYNEATRLTNQQQIVLVQQQNKLQNITREIGYKVSQLETLSATLEQNRQELQQIKKQLEELHALSGTNKQQLHLLLQDKMASETTLNRLEEEYYDLKGQMDREEKNIQELRRKGEQTDTVIRSLQEQTTEIRMKQLAVKERMEAEFNINIETMEPSDMDENISLEELRQRCDKLKIQIDSFGPVNPMALESFNEVKERFDFIVKEKNDLLQARESLLQTISEIDLTARDRFMEAYEKIRSHFITVFRSLFSEEDTCDLVLLEPNDPLESDLQIIAQPKGKRPLSIHQLSGGEKTLTATALLFGIYLLKPSPFCILDEVDAPLDDANIDKFTRLIRKFSDQSQFIIITHNKRTMAATDLIYGVTMSEPGITQVVPVDLKSYEMV